MKNDDPEHKEIGDRLAQVRRYYGLSEKDFASKAGIGSTQYNNWERGFRSPKISAAIRLVNTYNLTLDFIYLGNLSALPQNLFNALSSNSQDK